VNEGTFVFEGSDQLIHSSQINSMINFGYSDEFQGTTRKDKTFTLDSSDELIHSSQINTTINFNYSHDFQGTPGKHTTFTLDRSDQFIHSQTNIATMKLHESVYWRISTMRGRTLVLDQSNEFNCSPLIITAIIHHTSDNVDISVHQEPHEIETWSEHNPTVCLRNSDLAASGDIEATIHLIGSFVFLWTSAFGKSVDLSSSRTLLVKLNSLSEHLFNSDITRTSDSPSENLISPGIIVGIVIAGLIVVIAGIVAIVYFVRNRGLRPENSEAEPEIPTETFYGFTDPQESQFLSQHAADSSDSVNEVWKDTIDEA
jgi:hypothetical protein